MPARASARSSPPRRSAVATLGADPQRDGPAARRSQPRSMRSWNKGAEKARALAGAGAAPRAGGDGAGLRVGNPRMRLHAGCRVANRPEELTRCGVALLGLSGSRGAERRGSHDSSVPRPQLTVASSTSLPYSGPDRIPRSRRPRVRRFVTVRPSADRKCAEQREEPSGAAATGSLRLGRLRLSRREPCARPSTLSRRPRAMPQPPLLTAPHGRRRLTRPSATIAVTGDLPIARVAVRQ